MPVFCDVGEVVSSKASITPGTMPVDAATSGIAVVPPVSVVE
jgi:hypothetical protein